MRLCRKKRRKQYAKKESIEGVTIRLSPLATELGFTRARSLNDWPKSDKSDFG